MANFCIYKHSLYSGGYVTCPNDDVTFVSKCQSDIQSHEILLRLQGAYSWSYQNRMSNIKTFKN